MASPNGPSLQEAIALAQRMASNPADSVTLAGQLVDVLSGLPPAAGELLSRPFFERASLWTLGCSFENVGPTDEPPPQVIRCQHDVWIRGIVGQAYVRQGQPNQEPDDVIASLQFLRNMGGTNGRGLFEANFRLDGLQGFVSSGQSEILLPGTLLLGDGMWFAPMDWKLQKDQAIEVRLRSLVGELGLSAFLAPDPILLRWATINFWAEELNQPAVQ